MTPSSKYARVERERRFLLHRFPAGANVVRIRRVTDRYIYGTCMRLREQSDDSGSPVFKFTQKVPMPGSGAQQGFITSMYLTKDEFRVLSQLPAKNLSKTRYSLPPFGIDVFDGALQGLILAEAEFDSPTEADSLELPPVLREVTAREVSDDDRFTGGRLVRASRQDIESWLLEYGVGLGPL